MPSATESTVEIDSVSVEERSEEGGPLLPPGADSIIDAVTFEQILEMDDEDDHDFSKAIVFGFFEQAETTFEQMESLIRQKDLAQLSSLGHFLKGSSATLGLIKVKDSCEKVQNFGAKKDETGTKDVTDEAYCLRMIDETLATMREEYIEVKAYFMRFYSVPGDTESPAASGATSP